VEFLRAWRPTGWTIPEWEVPARASTSVSRGTRHAASPAPRSRCQAPALLAVMTVGARPAVNASPSTSPNREIDAAGGRRHKEALCHARPIAKRCFLCLSPTLRPWIACRRKRKVARQSSYVEELWSPMLCVLLKIRRQKHRLMPSANFRLARRGSFSLRRGLDSVRCLLQAGHHLLCCRELPPKWRRRPFRIAFVKARMRLIY